MSLYKSNDHLYTHEAIEKLRVQKEWDEIEELAKSGNVDVALAATDALFSTARAHKLNNVLIYRILDLNYTDSMTSERIAKRAMEKLFKDPDFVSFTPNALATITKNTKMKNHFERLISLLRK